jgi:hypothetical protein
MRRTPILVIAAACAALVAGCEQSAQTRSADIAVVEQADEVGAGPEGCSGAPCATEMAEQTEAETTAKTREASQNVLQALEAQEDGRGPEGCSGAPCGTSMQAPAEAAATTP